MSRNGRSGDSGSDCSPVKKDLDDADRTHEFQFGHYSREELLALCHAQGGDSHE